jgi:hypothetical protein
MNPEHWTTFETVPSPEQTAEAREIARNVELADKTIRPDELRFTSIVETLKERRLFRPEILRVKALFLPELGEFGETLENDVWEMLTVLDLFDPETALHCIDTYHIAKSKVEYQLSTGIVLADHFSDEGVTVKQFFVSCLLHDIGKVEVPHSVLVDRTTDEHCASLLFAHKDDVLIPTLRKQLHDETYELPAHINSSEALLTHLYDTLHTRPQMIAPMHLLLGEMTATEKAEIETQLTHCGCSLEDTLLKIMRTHDRYSKEILTQAGREIEAILAGSHHHSGIEESYTITIGTLRVSIDLAHIIHLADVENAILSVRHYKPEQTPLDALKVLTLHAQRGFVDGYISYLWIADDLYTHNVSEHITTEDEQADYALVTDFLDKQFAEHPEYPIWRIATKQDTIE